jgi:hypothetical protein
MASARTLSRTRRCARLLRGETLSREERRPGTGNRPTPLMSHRSREGGEMRTDTRRES